jgi:L-lactate utilization protein LutB
MTNPLSRRSALALAVLGWLGIVAQAAVQHPHIHHALHELREARTELREAKHDFGGHRKAALEALDVAIDQLDKAMDAVGDSHKGYTPPGGDVYKAYKHHPHIHHAINELKEARSELKGAAHDFKGYRVKALEAIDVAITQLEEALKFANKK